MFEPEKSHHFVDLDKLILKMYTVLRFHIVFYKIVEENRKFFLIFNILIYY